MLLIFTILESTEKTVSKMKAWCLIFALISEQVSSQSSSYSSSYSYASSGSTSEATNSSTDTTTATTTTTTTTTTTDPTTTTTAATTTTTTTTTTTAPTTTTAATTTSVSTTTAAVTTTSVSTTTTAPTTTSTAATTTTAPTTTTTAATTTTAPTTTTTAATTTTTAATTTSVSTTTAAVTTTSVSTTSTAPTTITATTTTSVVCQNEGELCNNFCKCPDKWSGPDCSIANHCVIITKDKYTFPETVIGYSAYSKETCQNDINAGFSKATAVCMNASGTIEFGPPNEMNCSLMLSAIDKYLSDHSDEISIQVLAYSTQILTSRPEHLTSSNITSAANILNQIFSMKTSDTTVAVAAMTTVSQLLFVSPQLVTGHDTELIPQQLESFLLNHTELLNVVQPKLAIQTTQVKISETAFIQFQALSGLSNNFTSSRIKLNSSKTEIKANDIPNDMQISIHLFPSDHADEKEEVKMGFALYDNDVLFQSKIFQPQLGTRRRVISASLDNANIQKDVNFSFKMDVQDVLNELVYDIACVSWDFTLKDWSNKGCFKVLSKSGSLLCRCNHTTNFAVLMSFSPDYKYAQALTWISTLGCTASIVGLGLTILFQIVTRKSRSTSPTVLLVSICMSMMIFYFLFLFGIENPNPNTNHTISAENIIPSSDLHQDPDKGPCTIFTALMQYFLLATFTWNTLYGAHIFLVIKKTLKGPPRWFLPFSIVMGWGSPAIIVALSLGLTYKVERPLDYRQEEFCWLAVLSISGSFDITKPMLWGFLLPVGIMLLFNTGVLVYFVHTTCNTNPLLTSTNKKTLKKKLMSSFSLGSVLGLSWVLGYLLLSMPPSPNLNILLSVAFCVATTTQGLQIFILFTVRTSLFQQKFSHVVNSMPAPEIALHSGKFILWDNNESGTHELYRGIDMDSRNENTYQNQ